MTDDRWFRMCKDAGKYIESKYFQLPPDADKNKFMDDVLRDPKKIIYEQCPDWTVDELIEMYSWKYGVIEKNTSENKMRMITYENMLFYSDTWNIKLMHEFVGSSWRDVWLQLVMWDGHHMTWDDAQSRWVKR